TRDASARLEADLKAFDGRGVDHDVWNHRPTEARGPEGPVELMAIRGAERIRAGLQQMELEAAVGGGGSSPEVVAVVRRAVTVPSASARGDPRVTDSISTTSDTSP